VAGKFRRSRAVKRNRDLIWVTTIFQASLIETPGIDIADVVLPADWQSGTGFDRATLLGVRGWICISQTAAGTAADIPGIWTAMYICGIDSPANTFDPYLAIDYVNYDTLWSYGYVGEASTRTQPSVQLNIKSKRKLTTGQEVRYAATVPVDTATPRFNVGGAIRALLQLDPPG